MSTTNEAGGAISFSVPGLTLKKLNRDQIKQIDEALASIGDYGEVRLILQHGELRYINKVESQKAWSPYNRPG